MDKQQLMRYGVFVVIGIAIGTYIAFPKKQLKVPEPVINEPITITPKESNLTIFFNTFLPFNENTGIPRIESVDPYKHMMIIYYATSQETSEYGVYDYKNDQLYLHLGSGGLGGGEDVLAIVGTDKILTFKVIEDQPTALLIKDFNGSVIKTLMTNIQQPSVSSEGESILVNMANGTESYILNQETLELIPATPRYI